MVLQLQTSPQVARVSQTENSPRARVGKSFVASKKSRKSRIALPAGQNTQRLRQLKGAKEQTNRKQLGFVIPWGGRLHCELHYFLKSHLCMGLGTRRRAAAGREEIFAAAASLQLEMASRDRWSGGHTSTQKRRRQQLFRA